MGELIDKTTVVAEIESYISNYKDIVAKTDRNDSTWVDSVSMIDAKIGVLQHLLFFLNTLEVKDVNDAYKQGYNDAIDKFCEFMQNCEGYVVSGTKCNYDNFIKYMEQ